MTAYLIAVAILGALISGPAWMNYGRKRTLEDLERWRRRHP